MMNSKLIRITTVPISLEKLLENQLKYMSDFFDVTAISSDKERLEDFGKEQGVDTYHIELTRKITPLKDILAVIKLYQFLRKEKPFVVHTHTPKAGIVGMLASYLAKVPNRLHTVAGMPLMEAIGLKRKVLNFVEKLTYACATKVYPNSFGLKQIIVDFNFTNPEKLKVLANGSSNGIDTSHLNPDLFSKQMKLDLKKSLGISENDFVYVFVGRIVGDKGINELIEAFHKLSQTKSSVKLLLVGPLEIELDPLKEDTLNLIEKNKQIISVGYQKDVRLYFAISNLLVFPSYREGFPNVVMQAGAMGLPSIVSDINGCNEIIKNEINGLIIPVKSIWELYKSMEELEGNKTKFEEIKNNSRELIINSFEQKYVWSELLKEYKRL